MSQQFVFEGTAKWKSEIDSDVIIKGKHLTTVSPPPEFGGKKGYLMPEEIFAASLASCMNTLFLLIAKNSNLQLKKLETKAILNMNAEGLEKLLFTKIHFDLTVGLEKDIERERKKMNTCFQIAQRICPIRQSWGENVPITFKLNVK